MRSLVTSALAATVVLALTATATATLTANAAAPDPVDRHAAAAVAYAATRGVTSSIAVLDTTTGHLWTGGDRHRRFAAASTAKVFTAVLVLARHKMTSERNRRDMWAMITQSDNDAWHRLGIQVGGARAITSVERRYHVQIGAEPKSATNWGATRVTALGMARMYGAIEKDKTVWPWLRRAMTHIRARSSAGVYQLFGIPAAHPVGGYALKQGWVIEEHDGRTPPYAVLNSTGYVDHTRYVVCIYTRGTPKMYDHVARGVLGRTISGEARRLLPHGRVQ